MGFKWLSPRKKYMLLLLLVSFLFAGARFLKNTNPTLVWTQESKEHTQQGWQTSWTNSKCSPCDETSKAIKAEEIREVLEETVSTIMKKIEKLIITPDFVNEIGQLTELNMRSTRARLTARNKAFLQIVCFFV